MTKKPELLTVITTKNGVTTEVQKTLAEFTPEEKVHLYCQKFGMNPREAVDMVLQQLNDKAKEPFCRNCTFFHEENCTQDPVEVRSTVPERPFCRHGRLNFDDPMKGLSEALGDMLMEMKNQYSPLVKAISKLDLSVNVSCDHNC